MKTQYYTASSIDGFIADVNHSLDWLFQFGQIQSLEEDFTHFFNGIGAAAMGSSTYEWLLEHEGLADHPEKWPYDIPVWVFSSRDQPSVEGANLHFTRGKVEPVHHEMVKDAKGKNIWIIGGGDLAGQFYDQRLLDEIILSVAPVILGAGAPLLPRKITSPPLTLLDAVQHDHSFSVQTYRVLHHKK